MPEEQVAVLELRRTSSKITFRVWRNCIYLVTERLLFNKSDTAGDSNTHNQLSIIKTSHLLFFTSLAVVMITAQVLFPGLRVNQVPLLKPTGNLYIVRTVELATPRPLLHQFK
uniref:Uncharacterized protein n=1 Tax=Glossina austeni TaxID=7395 RepID=A0A1A9UYP0_GLOAU